MYRLLTLLGGSASIALMGALLFLLAGTTGLPWVWVYLAVRLAFTVGAVLAMSEAVARERLKPGPRAKPEPLYNALTGVSWVAFLILAPLDLGSFHWSAGFPLWLQAASAVLLGVGYALVLWALRHNAYMSARIRIQGERGHHVVDTGPYALLRHPNYAGALLQSLTSGLLLGSWVGALALLLHCVALIYRTLNEEKVLLAELEGYADYTRRVPWRFIPGVW